MGLYHRFMRVIYAYAATLETVALVIKPLRCQSPSIKGTRVVI